ncbi:MAG: DUF4278 domain-containing protein [Nostoc sp.]
MKIYYRGLNYEYDRSKVSNKTEQPFEPDPQLGLAYNLMYSSVIYRVNPNSKMAEVPLPQLADKLSFRGITYFLNKTAQQEVTLVSQPASTSKIG